MKYLVFMCNQQLIANDLIYQRLCTFVRKHVYQEHRYALKLRRSHIISYNPVLRYSPLPASGTEQMYYSLLFLFIIFLTYTVLLSCSLEFVSFFLDSKRIEFTETPVIDKKGNGFFMHNKKLFYF